MRQNLVVVLLAVCATLLAVNLVVALRDPFPAALGQAVGAPVPGSNFILATGMNQTGNEAVLYIFDTQAKKLAAYTTRNQGVEFRGVRFLGYDLVPQEFNSRGRRASVDDMKKAVEK